MHKKQAGFTLIELMIVIAIIAIIAAIAIPNLLSARLNSNETAAIATLRNIVSAEAQFQTTARADGNTNGVGEYGYFGEMSGGAPIRGVALNGLLVPPVLSAAFRTVAAIGGNGTVTRSGYLYTLYLPDAALPGGPVAEDAANPGTPLAALDNDLAETTWCCYAWPSNYGNTGNRTFFVNQGGDILAINTPLYDGPGLPVLGDAAFLVAGDMTSDIAIGGAGQSGAAAPAVWRQVG